MRRWIGLLLGIGVAGALSASLARAQSAGTYLYVHDMGTANQVWRFRLNTNGSLDNLGAPVSTNNGNLALTGIADSAAYSPKRKLLFTGGNSGVSAFQVAANGSLMLVPGSPFGPQAEMFHVAVAEIGKKVFVYASETISETIHIYEVQSNGTLTPLPGGHDLALVLGGPTGIRVIGKTIFFGSRNGKTYGCKIAKDGILTAITGYTKQELTVAPTVSPDPKGKSLYVANTVTPEVLGYKLTGKQAPDLKDAPYAAGVTTGSGLGGLAVGNGSFIFAFAPPNGGTADVAAFKRAKNGILTAAGAAQNSGLPSLRGGTLDPTGQFLMLVDDVADQVKSFSINKTTGALTLVDTEAAAFGDGDVTGLVVVQP